jgi:hypothetical protein
MMAVDEEALICDLAQYYHIFDYRSLPPRTAATFAQGLPGDSRIARKLSGTKCSLSEMLLAGILDGASTIAWMLSENGKKDINRPASVLALLTKEDREEKLEGFSTPEEYEAEWRRITGGI